MNPRIQELAHQADLVIKKSNGNDFRFGAMDPKLEKFAELIVRECIEMAVMEEKRYHSLSAEDSALSMENFQDLLKQHFGVEE